MNLIKKSILIVLVSISTFSLHSQTINFKSNDLKNRIFSGYKHIIDKNQNNEIEVEEAETITYLNVGDERINDYSDLKYFSNLQGLVIGGPYSEEKTIINEIEFLADLKKLKDLTIKDAIIDNLSILENLKGIEKLQLLRINCKIFSPLFRTKMVSLISFTLEDSNLEINFDNLENIKMLDIKVLNQNLTLNNHLFLEQLRIGNVSNLNLAIYNSPKLTGFDIYNYATYNGPKNATFNSIEIMKPKVLIIYRLLGNNNDFDFNVQEYLKKTKSTDLILTKSDIERFSDEQVSKINEEKRKKEAEKELIQKRETERKEQEEVKKKNYAITQSKVKSGWKIGDRMCVQYDGSTIEGSLEQWNEDKTKFKVKIIGGQNDVSYKGEQIYKGNFVWIDANWGWYKCLGDEYVNYDLDGVQTGTSKKNEIKYKYSVGDKVVCAKWESNSGWEGTVLAKEDGKYFVKITRVVVNGFFSTQLNASECNGNEPLKYDDTGEKRWISKYCVE